MALSWVRVPTSIDLPGPGAVLFDMRWDVANEQIVLFGNVDVGGEGQTWAWDGSDWSLLHLEGTPGAELPVLARFASGAYDRVRNNLVTQGGYLPQDVPIRCCPGPGGPDGTLTWVALDSPTQTWDGSSWSSVVAGGDRRLAALAWHPGTEKVVLFGGGDAWQSNCPEECGGFTADAFYLDDTRTWDGSSWTVESPAHSPGVVGPDSIANFEGALAGGDRMETFGDDVVLVRGVVGPYLSAGFETWTWDGTDWTQHFPAHSPPVRYEYASAYHPGLDLVLIYGGHDPFGGPIFGDTWAWDGSDWSEIIPPTYGGPGPLFGAGMEYDEAREEMILHGGSSFASDIGSHLTYKLGESGPYVLDGAESCLSIL